MSKKWWRPPSGSMILQKNWVIPTTQYTYLWFAEPDDVDDNREGDEEDIVDQMAQLSVDGAVGGLAQADGAVRGRRRPRSPSKLKKCVTFCPCIPACAVVSRCQCDPPPDTPCASAFSCKRYSQVNLSNLQKKSLIFHHDLKRIYLRLPERLNLRKWFSATSLTSLQERFMNKEFGVPYL